MPGLFEQFPHTNLHELNLDWMIDLLNTFKDELENRAVLSVNGMTGEVTLYESENVVLPPLTEASSWRLVRMMDGQYVGILFQDGHIWLQQGNSTLKLLTTEDIPTSAGVVSINGMGGIVTLTGRDIAIDDSPDADSIRLALQTESTTRQTADSALNQEIDTERQDRVNADNAINNSITSLQAGKASQFSDVIGANADFNVPIISNTSAHAGFAIITLDISGNALAGMATIVLGHGTGKHVVIAGNMDTTNYTLTYQNRQWTIHNNTADPLIITGITIL